MGEPERNKSEESKERNRIQSRAERIWERKDEAKLGEPDERNQSEK